MIVPLQKGAGTRGKIAFGFSRRCPIVSTSVGAYGYEIENGREIILADRSDHFAEGLPNNASTAAGSRRYGRASKQEVSRKMDLGSDPASDLGGS